MGCQSTKCPNCKRPTQACKMRKAKDGSTCCVTCVTQYNNSL